MGSGVCGKGGFGEKILYAWGRNAPVLKLPPGKWDTSSSSSSASCLKKKKKKICIMHYKQLHR